MESAAGSTKDFAFSVRMRTRRGGHHDDVSNPGAAIKSLRQPVQAFRP